MKNESLTIGFTGLINFRSVIGQDILFGINSAAKDFNINLINFLTIYRYSVNEDKNSFMHYKNKLNYLNQNNIDGLISWSSSLQSIMKKSEIENFHYSLRPLPVISIGMPIKNIPNVISDQYSGIKALMTHLINVHGNTKIAFIGGKNNYIYEERFNIYKKILKENNITYNPDLVYLLNDIEDEEEIKDCVDAIFNKRKLICKKDIETFLCVNDIVAQKLVEELHILGINIPNDVAVTGYNNQFNSLRSYPPITTIDPDFFQIGYQAVVALLSIIRGNNKPDDFLMPCKLIIRQSCGCFENIGVKTEIKELSANKEKTSFDLFVKNNQENIILKLKEIIIKFDNNFNITHARELFDNFINDIINNTSYRFLNVIKQMFFDYKNVTENKLAIWQNVVLEIRNILLPYFIGNSDISFSIENIFHQARVMIDVAYTYLNFSKKSDIYKTGALVKLATDISSVKNLNEIVKLIENNLNELEIPGVYLALLNEPGDIDKSKLIFSYNIDEKINLYEDTILIPKNYIVPKSNLPKNRQFTMIFELLYYNDLYLGFILFEMGSTNLPIYDTFRIILSPSLYRAIIDNKKVEPEFEQKLLLDNLKFNIKNFNLEFNDKNNLKDKINSQRIIKYLLNHINEPTDLEKIAQDFNLSISSVIRKSKKLTGHSIQKLHELLKIEKAKLLLKDKELTILEISKLLGYQNQYYFSSVFKKCTGVSPKKWSKKI